MPSNATLVPLFVQILAIVVFTATANNFLEPRNLSLIVQQVMVVGTLGIAQTLVILTAGIDLSVGAIMVLSSIVMAKLSADHGVPGLLALLIGFGVGTACGLLNGALVTRLRLPPFIVTLGTLNIFFALNLYYSKSETVRGVDMPGLLLWTGNTIDIGDTKITYGSLLMVALFGVFWYVLKNTAWGRHVYAVGDDAEAARLAGVRTNRVLLSVYIVAGLICAVAAWMLIGRIASASPQAGGSANLDSITAVVIGDNGAGKSTLIKCLSGAVVPDDGEIRLDGEPVQMRSPLDARALGIETVYQTLAVSPSLDIADNLFLGREPRAPGIMGKVFRKLDLG